MLSRLRSTRLIYIVVTTCAFIVVVAALSIVSGGSYSTRSEVPEAELDSVGLEIRTVQVDPTEGALDFLATPRAQGVFGQDLPNGAFFTYPVTFNLDVASGESTVSVPGSSVRGAIPATVYLQGSESTYPFDTYQARLFTSASSSAQEGVSFVLSDAAQEVAGFSISSELVSILNDASDVDSLRSDQQSGFGMLEWRIERSNATKLLAILLGLIMISGAVVSLAITAVIVLRRRPPSIAVMVWLAVFLFALFQIRGQLPGGPPAGIGFDRFVFFPVVLILVLLIVVNLVAWSTRDDWDLENPASLESEPGSLLGRNHE